MIGKLKKGSSFGGCIRYVTGKDEARIIASDGVLLGTNAEITQSFELQRQLNPRIKKPVGHIALSFKPEDKPRLTDEFMAKIAIEYMQMMGITDTQFIIVRHHNTDNPHCHIVYNRINNAGKLISDRNDYRRNEQVTKALKSKYGFTYGTDKRLGFFPHIVEGPIGRFDLLGEQLYEGHSFDYTRVTQGIQLMFWGLFKKLVVADRAAIFVDTVFNDYTNYSGMYVVIAMLLYTLQLYAEFSGCMDIVMGSAEIFGVKLDKNFERPFISKTVSEFWRRWHMTLGGWFRDYVFYPISLSKSFTKFSKKVKAKCSPFVTRILPAAMAMFVVWFGTGIWHGASLKYIMYGLYYYIIMVAGMLTEPLWCRLFDKLKVDRKGKVYRALQVVRTFIFVNIGMLLFRTDNMGSFFHMFRSMFSNLSLSVLTDGSLLNLGIDKMDITVIIIGLIFIIIAGVLGERGCNIREAVAGKNIVVRWVLYYALVLAVLILGAYGFNYPDIGFIYAQF